MADLATNDLPFGFQQWGPAIHVGYYAIVTAYATAVHPGDLMEAVGEAVMTPHMGNLQKAAIEETGASGTILGAVVSVYDSDFNPLMYLPAATTGNGTIAGYVGVLDSPDQEYLVQEDGDTSSLVVANIGLNIQAISTHAGNTTTGASKMEIDSSSVASNADYALKLLGVHPEDTISSAGTAGNYCRFIVKVNSAYRGDEVTGV